MSLPPVSAKTAAAGEGQTEGRREGETGETERENGRLRPDVTERLEILARSPCYQARVWLFEYLKYRQMKRPPGWGGRSPGRQEGRWT